MEKRDNRLLENSMLLTNDAPFAYAEAFKTLRTNLSFASISKQYKKIIITSAIPNEGKSTVAVNLAITLAESDAKVLLIYSDDDKIVDPGVHFDYLKEKLKGRKNITLMLLSGKNHNPGYTLDAVTYKDGFFAQYQKAAKKLTTSESRKEFMDRYDWLRMTEQDEAVWGPVIEHLKSE